MSYLNTLLSSVASLSPTWPLQLLSMSPQIRQALAPQTRDGSPVMNCPCCMGQGTVTIDMQSRPITWTCEREHCEKFDIHTPVVDLFRMVGDYESETETCIEILRQLNQDIPEREETEAISFNEITLAELPNPAQIGESRFIKLPKNPAEYNIFEAIWVRLTLLDKHREELREKRGFVKDNWIEDCGFRSSIRQNIQLTKDVIDLFPPNKLLESGVFKRDKFTKKITLASFMAGAGLNRDKQFQDGLEPIIIPYIDKHGRITCLRPHKTNLTNKEYLEHENMEHYSRQLFQLLIPYGECFLNVRENSDTPHTIIICEGEFKAAALAMVGIAAVAVPGIYQFRNEQFRKLMLDMLNRDDIKHIVIAFDREDKRDKEFKKRFEAKIYALYMAHILERYQFRCRVLDLPDAWMEGDPGKADWDGALSMFIRHAKTPDAGIKKATDQFKYAIAKAPELQKQFSLFGNAEERIIQHKLNRLLHEPKVFVGTDKVEGALAAEITRHFPEKFKSPYLNPDTIAQALRDSVGCFYVYKTPTDKQVENLALVKEEIHEKLDELQDSQDDDDRRLKRQLYCVLNTINVVLYKMPKPVANFSLVSKYKVRCSDGNQDRLDRLVTFYDQHGLMSRQSFQVSSKDTATATEFRKFVTACGNYNWHAGQTEIDLVAIHMDVDNYHQTISEVDMLGWHKQHKIWLLGDCAIAENGKIIFPDHDKIIWCNGEGYLFNQNTAKNFTQKPPVLFPGMDTKTAKEFLRNMDWEQERTECAAIFKKASQIFYTSYGDHSGYLHIGTLLSFLAHPELLQTGDGAKPSMWIQAAKGSGKTVTTSYSMMMLGFPRDYNYITLNGTTVGVERTLMQYSCLPLHLDEWKNKDATDKLVGLVRSCFNQQTAPKGVKDNARNTRQVTPMTIPVVTGEDATTDPATQSRFIQLVMAARKRNDYIAANLATMCEYFYHDIDPAIRRKIMGGDVAEAIKYFFAEIESSSHEFYRIGRFLFKHREEFTTALLKNLKATTSSVYLNERITDSRARFVYGTAIASFLTLRQMFGLQTTDEANIVKAMIDIGSAETAETEANIFRNKWFEDGINLIQRGNTNAAKFLISTYGVMGDNAFYQATPSTPGAKLYILVAAKELYTEIATDMQRQGLKPDIALPNIAKELGKQPYWMPYKKEPRVWRLTMQGDIRRKWWILDYSLMHRSEQNIFETIIPETAPSHTQEELVTF